MIPPGRTRKTHGYEITDSSNVRSIDWGGQGMTVEFKGGSIYWYRGVSRQRAVACALAKSVGKYINEKIKPNYEVVRVA